MHGIPFPIVHAELSLVFWSFSIICFVAWKRTGLNLIIIIMGGSVIVLISQATIDTMYPSSGLEEASSAQFHNLLN